MPSQIDHAIPSDERHDQKEPSDLLERIARGSHQNPQLYNKGGGIQAQRTHYTKCVIGRKKIFSREIQNA